MQFTCLKSEKFCNPDKWSFWETCTKVNFEPSYSFLWSVLVYLESKARVAFALLRRSDMNLFKMYILVLFHLHCSNFILGGNIYCDICSFLFMCLNLINFRKTISNVRKSVIAFHLQAWRLRHQTIAVKSHGVKDN